MKTSMREAFEAVQIKPGEVYKPVIRRVLRVMNRGAGIVFPRRRAPSQTKRPA